MHACEAFHSLGMDNYTKIEVCETNTGFHLALLSLKGQQH